MYDGDLEDVVENLKQCKGVLLLSKPCIEIWFISHYKKPLETEIRSEHCVEQLKTITNWKNYRKAVLSSIQESELWDKKLIAVSNMESKAESSKAYSSIFKFIKILEKEAAKK